jgi:Tfp pilus assembly protein PilF
MGFGNEDYMDRLEAENKKLKDEIKHTRDNIEAALVYLNNSHINAARETLLKALNEEKE